MSVHYTEDSGLALVTLAESARGNRINSATLTALHDSLDRAEKSDAARFVILRSNGNIFCHGMDFGFFLSRGAARGTTDGHECGASRGAESAITDDHERGTARGAESTTTDGHECGADAGKAAARDVAVMSAEEAVRAYSGLLTRMRTFPKLIIALVDGEVKAGGVGIVAAADIVLCSLRSSFQLSEVFLGLLPANVLPFLIERLGAARAAYLTLSARTLSAAEAQVYGLADEVFAPDTLEKETRAYIRTLLRADPYALGRGKSFVAELRECGTRKEMTDRAEQALLDLSGRADVRAAICAFEDGGLPSWSAKLKLSENLWIGAKNE
jgi:methylglutaconyl-CoA hydratase/polyketide biosynthesis enoyl-CoA hydratase PksH